LIEITGTRPAALDLAELNCECATTQKDFLYWITVASALNGELQTTDSVADRMLVIDQTTRPSDWKEFTSTDLAWIVRYLVDRLDRGVCGEWGSALLFLCAGELHRRQSGKAFVG
jgi:hypothetical protein